MDAERGMGGNIVRRDSETEKAKGVDVKYVVAVSGGIDSMVLLDILSRYSSASLVVAHVDHAVRPDSHEDEQFVRAVAKDYGHSYASCRLEGSGSDEASLRRLRYEFLERVRDEHQADAIVTAHHQDDAIETMVINHLRGTGWRGVASLRSHPRMLRPLLPMSKAGVVRYALDNQIKWREDSTNQDVRYLRNAVRHHVVPRLGTRGTRHELSQLYHKHGRLRAEIDAELAHAHKAAQGKRGIKRYYLIMMPRDLAQELLYYLAPNGMQAQHVRQLLHFARTAKNGAKLHLPDGIFATVTTDELIVKQR